MRFRIAHAVEASSEFAVSAAGETTVDCSQDCNRRQTTVDELSGSNHRLQDTRSSSRYTPHQFSDPQLFA